MDLGLLFTVQRWSMQMRSLVGELVRRWWRLRRSPPPGFSHGSTGVWEARGAGRVGLRGRCPPPGGEDTSRDWVWEGWLIQGDTGVVQMTGTWAGEGSSWGED